MRVLLVTGCLVALTACGNASNLLQTEPGPPPLVESPSAILENAATLEEPTTPVGLSLSDLVQRANYICLARVRAVSAQRESYDPQIEMVMSRIRLAIITNLKGHLPDGTEIRSFGGFLDGIPYFAEIFPQFVEGEEVLLFLGNFNGGIFPIEHIFGVWTIENGTIKTTGQPLQEVSDAIRALLR